MWELDRSQEKELEEQEGPENPKAMEYKKDGGGSLFSYKITDFVVVLAFAPK